MSESDAVDDARLPDDSSGAGSPSSVSSAGRHLAAPAVRANRQPCAFERRLCIWRAERGAIKQVLGVCVTLRLTAQV
jgi:hypothetical protein